MADITKCHGEGCDKKEGCYRFVAEEEKLQSWFSVSPLEKDGSCDRYWPLKKEKDDGLVV